MHDLYLCSIPTVLCYRVTYMFAPKTERPRSDNARPKKSLGQNFLVDRRVLGKIVAGAEVSPDDLVLEIGPGKGTLTRELAKTAAQVIAVEIDESLAARLTEDFADTPNVRIIPGDAREIDIASLVPGDTSYKLVANLPYYAASPIVRRFLEATRKPLLMVVMVQREVAQNMAATPGKMTILSVATQLYGSARIVSAVPPRAFRPSPKVTSAIIRIDVYSEPALDVDSIEGFFTLVKAGFSSPRKQIHNCLKQGLAKDSEAVEEMLGRAGIDPRRRPQTLSMPEWGSLYQAFLLHCSHDRDAPDKARSEGSRQG